MTLELPMDLLHDVFGTAEITPGMARRVPGWVVLELKSLPIDNRRVIHDVSPSIPVEMTLSDESSVEAFVGWLCRQLVKFKRQRVVIDGRWVAAKRIQLLEAILSGPEHPIKVTEE